MLHDVQINIEDSPGGGNLSVKLAIFLTTEGPGKFFTSAGRIAIFAGDDQTNPTMILIADSGSTKTDWVILSPGAAPGRFKSSGMNPNFMDSAEAAAELMAAFPAGLSPEEVREVHFYGAGISPATAGKVEALLRGLFPGAGAMSLESDLLGAARALQGDGKGFVAILGTGSNSCLYDGGRICRNVPSLGFILGDEGSGSAIGKDLLRDYFRGGMPGCVSEDFREYLGMDLARVIDRIYTQARPSAFCASLARFALERMDADEYASRLVDRNLEAFFGRVVGLYDGLEGLAFNAAGSVALLCKDRLMSLAAERGMRPGKVLGSPAEGLADYHSGRMSGPQRP